MLDVTPNESCDVTHRLYGGRETHDASRDENPTHTPPHGYPLDGFVRRSTNPRAPHRPRVFRATKEVRDSVRFISLHTMLKAYYVSLLTFTVLRLVDEPEPLFKAGYLALTFYLLHILHAESS